MDNILQLLAATAQLMDATLSPQSLAVMASDFSGYDRKMMEIALKNVRMNHTRFSPAAIKIELDKLDKNKRIGADEAWAMIPHNEYDSVVWTNEMAEAYNTCYRLVEDGDMVAARMAFKSAYERITSDNKSNGINPVWQASLGSDIEGREKAINEAKRLGRLSESHANTLLPYRPSEQLTNAVALLANNGHTDEQKENAKNAMIKINAILNRPSK